MKIKILDGTLNQAVKAFEKIIIFLVISSQF